MESCVCCLFWCDRRYVVCSRNGRSVQCRERNVLTASIGDQQARAAVEEIGAAFGVNDLRTRPRRLTARELAVGAATHRVSRRRVGERELDVRKEPVLVLAREATRLRERMVAE